MQAPLLQKRVFAWALYDWANSAFATTVMVVFFPLFFKQYLTADQAATTSTFWLGMTNGVASFVLALMAPWLGSLADKGSAHLRFLFLFTVIGVVATALLAFVGVSAWALAAVLFAVASVGFWGGLIFYDSMLIQVAPPGRADSVSGFGYALGYLGGGVLLTLNVVMYARPALFGLADRQTAIRVAFLSVAVWWALFSIPLLRARPTTASIELTVAARAGFAQLLRTLAQLRRYRAAALFLLAYWMYIDGVNTIMKMAVDYGLALGFPADSLITGILVIQYVGFPATLLFGYLGDRVSPLLGIFIAIAVYGAVTVYAVFMREVSEFYVMAAAIGCVQGAIQSMSRSYYSRLIPADRAGEFYGFYNMMGKFAAVLGPMLMGTTALLTGSSRTAIVSLIVLFIGGAVLLLFTARQPSCAADLQLRQ